MVIIKGDVNNLFHNNKYKNWRSVKVYFDYFAQAGLYWFCDATNQGFYTFVIAMHNLK